MKKRVALVSLVAAQVASVAVVAAQVDAPAQRRGVDIATPEEVVFESGFFSGTHSSGAAVQMLPTQLSVAWHPYVGAKSKLVTSLAAGATYLQIGDEQAVLAHNPSLSISYTRALTGGLALTLGTTAFAPIARNDDGFKGIGYAYARGMRGGWGDAPWVDGRLPVPLSTEVTWSSETTKVSVANTFATGFRVVDDDSPAVGFDYPHRVGVARSMGRFSAGLAYIGLWQITNRAYLASVEPSLGVTFDSTTITVRGTLPLVGEQGPFFDQDSVWSTFLELRLAIPDAPPSRNAKLAAR